jgi:prophage antirepressor-like protein
MSQPTFLHDFEGKALFTYTWQGRPCWVARHLGRTIGYSHDGKRLPNKILGAWANEFVLGQDYDLLAGDDLARFNDAVPRGLIDQRVGRRSLLILYRSGALLALVKTELEVGQRLRRFLVDQVLPEIVRTGSYAADRAGDADGDEVPTPVVVLPHAVAPDPAPRLSSLHERREARLYLQARTRARWVELCDRRLKVATLHRMIDALAGEMDEVARASIEVLAAEIAVGLPIAEVMFPDPDDAALLQLDLLREAA